MDTEIRQAQRIIQRSGAKVLTDAATREEFPLQYGELVLQWIRHQGMACHVIRLVEEPFLRHSHQSAASKVLEAQHNIRVQIVNHHQFRSANFAAGTIDAAKKQEPNFDDIAMAGYLSHISPMDLIVALDNAKRFSSQVGPTQNTLFFFVEEYRNFSEKPTYTVSAYVYHYKVPTPEEIAAEDEKNKKDIEKKLAAAEKRRKTMEAKEKALLKKLQDKYGAVT